MYARAHVVLLSVAIIIVGDEVKASGSEFADCLIYFSLSLVPNEWTASLTSTAMQNDQIVHRANVSVEVRELACVLPNWSEYGLPLTGASGFLYELKGITMDGALKCFDVSSDGCPTCSCSNTKQL